MIRSLLSVSGFTLASRILGFVRDILIAKYIGVGTSLADVWVAAFRFPNLFRRIFGEGAFNAAFVPMYSRRLEEGGEAVADAFARRTLSLMLVILLAIFALAFIFMEPIVSLTNIGFAERGLIGPAVDASRITVVYLVFICLVAGFTGILNSRKVFAAPAFAYVVMNLVFLAALFFVMPKTESPVEVLCWSVVVSGVLQLAVVVVAAWRRGVNLRPRLPKIDDDMKRLGSLMGPGLISAGVQQVNLIVGQTVASIQEGGVSLIFFADRINQLPLGLIGIAAGTVLLPEITRRIRGGDEVGARRSMAEGLELALLLCLPATVAMLAIPREIMFALFEGRSTSAENTFAAGWILGAFALGTPAYVLARVLQPGYFAREDTKTPMRFTMISAGVNIVLCYPFFLWLGALGCALATSVAGWVTFLLLWSGLKRDGFLSLEPTFWGRVSRILIAAIIMGAAVAGLAWWGKDWLLIPDAFWRRIPAILILVAAGMVVYAASIFGLRVYSPRQLRSKLRRG
ncbi:MAG: murein biosynthesis integral membrane protein MurJ [Verrucomicrobiota bacterium]